MTIKTTTVISFDAISEYDIWTEFEDKEDLSEWEKNVTADRVEYTKVSKFKVERLFNLGS